MRLPRHPRRACALAAVGVTWLVVSGWRRSLTWGATSAEVASTIPGDESVGRARYRSTHAVTIAATCEEVWPWVLQLGQGRGGFYSYDWLENLVGLDIHSATRLEPDLQRLAVGDAVRLVPDGTTPPLGFVVTRLEAPTLLVLGPVHERDVASTAHLPFPFWTFQLDRSGDQSCRLVVRFQTDFASSLWDQLAYKYALAPVHLLMERRMLLGIQRRAESSAGSASPLRARTA